jgi:hypothetical protein
MKKITALFAFFALSIALFFVACQKETVNPSVQTTVKQTAGSEVTSRVAPGGCILTTGPFNFRSQQAYIGCVSGFGVCDDWFPYPGGPFGPLEGNQAMGNSYIDSDGAIVFDIDGSTISEGFWESVAQNPVFSISSPYVVPQPFINDLYSCSGMPLPAGPVVFHPGDYPVDIDIDPAVMAMPFPWWTLIDVDVEVKWKRNADGSEELTIKVHCC